MKIADQITRFIVGVLFTFSGFVKLVDPKGTKIKLTEYFHVFSNDIGSFFEALIPATLIFAVIFVVLETLLGILVLINYRMRITSWVLLITIIFFTFLTFYSAYFNKVTDCGCFGDFMKLDPWTSFFKDLVLLVLILYMFIRRYQLEKESYLNNIKGDILTSILGLIILWFSIHNIRHLPFIDFRPYKVGNNIPKLMKPSCPLKYEYVFTKNGNKIKANENNYNQYFEDTTYKYKDMQITNEECMPKITDYRVWSDTGDVTEKTFKGNKLLIIIYNSDKACKDSFEEINKLIANLSDMPVKPMVLTATESEKFEKFRHEIQLAVPYYSSDGTVLKTMIRSNPGIMLLKDGIVKEKWHYNDTPSKEDISKLIKENK